MAVLCIRHIIIYLLSSNAILLSLQSYIRKYFMVQDKENIKKENNFFFIGKK